MSTDTNPEPLARSAHNHPAEHEVGDDELLLLEYATRVARAWHDDDLTSADWKPSTEHALAMTRVQTRTPELGAALDFLAAHLRGRARDRQVGESFSDALAHRVGGLEWALGEIRDLCEDADRYDHGRVSTNAIRRILRITDTPSASADR